MESLLIFSIINTSNPKDTWEQVSMGWVGGRGGGGGWGDWVFPGSVQLNSDSGS